MSYDILSAGSCGVICDLLRMMNDASVAVHQVGVIVQWNIRFGRLAERSQPVINKRFTYQNFLDFLAKIDFLLIVQQHSVNCRPFLSPCKNIVS